MKSILILWIFLPLIYPSLTYPVSCPALCECRPIENKITCSVAYLEDIPEGVSADISILDLSFNEFKDIPAKLADFNNLTDLDLSHNKITTLTKNSFKGLYKLKKLNLAHNKFNNWADLHPYTFYMSKDLTYLNLSSNFLWLSAPIKTPILIPSLHTLDLSNCSLETLTPRIWEGFPNLTHFILSENSFPNINPDDLTYLPNLQILNLQSNNIEKIHSNSLLALKKLRQLILADNYDLQNFACLSPSLKHLDLSNCALSSLPQVTLPNLRSAIFQGNRLRALPDDSFRSFLNLTYLDLSRNVIKSIGSEAFRRLDWIQTINLRFNPFNSLAADTFNTNFRLQYLYLSQTYLTEVPAFDMESIRVLDLSECEINFLSRGSLRRMPQLKSLDLSKNFITTLPDYLESESLGDLSMAFCRITTISKNTFKNMPSLRKVNLVGNRLTTAFNISFLHHIETVKLGDNLWRCYCNSTTFRFFHEYLKDVAEDYYSLRCDFPEEVRGKQWEIACGSYWYGGNTLKDNAWPISVGILVSLCIALCFAYLVKRGYKRKAEERRQMEEMERAEARDRLIQQRLRAQQVRQDQNRNAPDPREQQRPPCYDEAILLPRIDGSMASLAGSLHSQDGGDKKKKKRRRRRRSKTKSGSESELQSSSALSGNVERRGSKGNVASDSDTDPQSSDPGPVEAQQGRKPPIKVYKESNI